MAHIKICPQCQEEFEGRSNRKYCSDHCKMESFQLQRQKQKESENESYQSIPSKEVNNNTNTTYGNLSSKEVKLKKHELDLQHQRKLILLEQNKQQLELQAREAELDRIRKEEELAKELEKKQLAEVDRKEFAPIKIAIYEILLEIIENGKDAIWPIEDVEDLLEDIEATTSKVKKYCSNKSFIYKNSVIYTTLVELEQELQDVLDEKSSYINAEEVLINFKKSYLRELQTVLKRLEDGLPMDHNRF